MARSGTKPGKGSYECSKRGAVRPARTGRCVGRAEVVAERHVGERRSGGHRDPLVQGDVLPAQEHQAPTGDRRGTAHGCRGTARSCA